MKVKAKGRKISLKMTESRDTLSRAVYLNEFFFYFKKKENMAAVKVTERRQLAFTDPLASIGRFRLQKSQNFFFLYFAQFSLLGLSAALPNHTNRFILASAKYSDEWAHMWSKLWLHAQINSRLPTTDIPAEGRKQLIGQLCHFLTREKMAPGWNGDATCSVKFRVKIQCNRRCSSRTGS